MGWSRRPRIYVKRQHLRIREAVWGSCIPSEQYTCFFYSFLNWSVINVTSFSVRPSPRFRPFCSLNFVFLAHNDSPPSPRPACLRSPLRVCFRHPSVTSPLPLKLHIRCPCTTAAKAATEYVRRLGRKRRESITGEIIGECGTWREGSKGRGRRKRGRESVEKGAGLLLSVYVPVFSTSPPSRRTVLTGNYRGQRRSNNALHARRSLLFLGPIVRPLRQPLYHPRRIRGSAVQIAAYEQPLWILRGQTVRPRRAKIPRRWLGIYGLVGPAAKRWTGVEGHHAHGLFEGV
jgi:hypothetical protein